MLHHAFVPTHPEPKPKDTPLNFTSLGLRLSSHTSLFWTLPEQLSILHHTCEPTRPEPTSQDTLQTSDLFFFISHICFELCRNSSPCYTTHVSQPILNQRPKTHYKLQSENFHLKHPCFELCGNRLHHACVPTRPEPTSQDTLQTSDPIFLISHICVELCRNSSPCYATHVSQPILY